MQVVFMKTYVSIDIPDIGIRMLEEAGLDLEVWKGEQPMSQHELLEKVSGFEILLSSSVYKLDAGFLEANPQLKFISQYAAGYDNIDLDSATELGIMVANTPHAMTEATADIALGLLLAVSRKICFMHKKIGRDQWGAFRPKANLGIELRGKTLGILGLGRIGTAFASRCQAAYGMNVIYHNRSHNPEGERQLQAQYVSFEQLLAKSDILSVHCALTDKTRGIMDMEAFRQMKTGAIFINTARGGIHNEEDLIAALEEGAIWGAGLDVTNPEPMRADNPLLEMENVAVTPHIGSATKEARDEMARLAALNIIEYVAGREVVNKVNQV